MGSGRKRSGYLKGGKFEDLIFGDVIYERHWHVSTWEGESGHFCVGLQSLRGEEMGGDATTASDHKC